MHDKADTKTRLQHVLSHTDIPVELHFYYPMTHYAGREVPEAVSSILEPLDIHEAATMDGFIITGSPIETLEFDQVHYIAACAQPNVPVLGRDGGAKLLFRRQQVDSSAQVIRRLSANNS